MAPGLYPTTPFSFCAGTPCTTRLGASRSRLPTTLVASKFVAGGSVPLKLPATLPSTRTDESGIALVSAPASSPLNATSNAPGLSPATGTLALPLTNPS